MNCEVLKYFNIHMIMLISMQLHLLSILLLQVQVECCFLVLLSS